MNTNAITTEAATNHVATDAALASQVAQLKQATLDYLARSQVFTPGDNYGAFWSEKAYHGPLLDFHAGGAHHNRGAGSAALALHMADNDPNSPLKRKAELAFDWLTTRQRPSGGFLEIQNNDKPSDWEGTGLEECSSISTAFAMRGLGYALLNGLPPKPSYARALRDAGLWQISIENPPGSGILPHHERSPHDCLNANVHGAEMLMAAYRALADIYGCRIEIFAQAARRAVEHTLTLQHEDGFFPYRAGNGITINYTAMVTWCMLNIFDIAPAAGWRDAIEWQKPIQSAADFLRSTFTPGQGFDWQTYETSTANHNTHTYLLVYNTLKRVGGKANDETCDEILRFLLSKRADDGLLPVKDEGEVITECLPMQADMLLCFHLHPAKAAQ